MLAGGQTGFAAAHPIPPGMREPMLVSCTDGVGTKLLLAQELRRLGRARPGPGGDVRQRPRLHRAPRPMVFLDYLAVGRLDPDEAAVLVRSIADACTAVGCVLAGGETAEMPGLYAPGHFDLAGFACGVVERADMLGPAPRGRGRRDRGRSRRRASTPTATRWCGRWWPTARSSPDPELLLAPTRLYVRELARARRRPASRCGRPPTSPAAGWPRTCRGRSRRACGRCSTPRSWERGPARRRAARDRARVDEDEAWGTFNMGLGMCLLVAPGDVPQVAGGSPTRAHGRAAAAARRGSGPWLRRRLRGGGAGVGQRLQPAEPDRHGARRRRADRDRRWWSSSRDGVPALAAPSARRIATRGGGHGAGASAPSATRELGDVVARPPGPTWWCWPGG